MPYLLLAIGLALAGFFLFRLSAQGRQTGDYGALVLVLCVAAGAAAVLFILMGRWPVAALLIAAAALVSLRLLRLRKPSSTTGGDTDSAMTREQAFEVLGLSPDAPPEEIRRAHRALMAKVHPDHEGSGWMAAKLNQARDVLLPEDGSDAAA